MPFAVLFAFLTVPVLVGVAWTLALPGLNCRSNAPAVVCVAGAWLFLALHFRRRLESGRRRRWVGRWLAGAVFLPLVVPFALSLAADPEVVARARAFDKANAERLEPWRAQAGPAARALTAGQTRELLALIRPRAYRFAVQILASLPTAWWIGALVLSLWKGK